jgi:SpoVK/Ycf46/Vps4 family AAA+-type ATPase
VVGFRDCLLEKLIGEGFKRICFHHPLDGVAIYEVAEVPPLKDAPEQAASPSIKPTKQLVEGPMGGFRVKGAAHAEPMPAAELPSKADSQTGRMTVKYQKLPDIELSSHIRGFFRAPGKAAYVFLSLEHLTTRINESVLGDLEQFLRDMAADGSGRRCILVAGYRDVSRLIPRDNDRRHPLYTLKDYFFDAEHLPYRNVIQVGPPDAAELEHAFHRQRIEGKDAPSTLSIREQAERRAADLRSAWMSPSSSLRESLSGQGISTMEAERAEDSTALEVLRDLPGLAHVADKLEGLIRALKAQVVPTTDEPDPTNFPERLSGDRPSSPAAGTSLNFALVGPPGTGKTTVARLIGRALKEEGLLSSGHLVEATGKDLVAEFVGQSAPKTAQLFESAMGGTLFIDEVQSLSAEGEFHVEARQAMLKYLEDRKGEMAVIVATYPDKFEDFLSADQGLDRRFDQRRRIMLESYDGATSAEIFRLEAHRLDLSIDDELNGLLPQVFEFWRRDRKARQAFANAGTIIEFAMGLKEGKLSQGSDLTISVSDLPSELAAYADRARRRDNSGDAIEHVLEELNSLIGLEKVKSAINQIVNRLRVSQATGDGGVSPGHMVFTGNPGTGKTTVARLLGDIYRELGVLASGHVEEVLRGNLVAEYQGQTEAKTLAACQSALDGILFIDEAHNLINSDQDAYGREAIGALTPFIENNRDRLSVILAGYPEPIRRLFEVDPGWKSRFSTFIEFEDYSEDEMSRIFRSMVAGAGYELADDLDGTLPLIMARLRAEEGQNFGNGRSARNLFGQIQAGHDQRVVQDMQNTRLKYLLLTDVPNSLRPSSADSTTDKP